MSRGVIAATVITLLILITTGCGDEADERGESPLLKAWTNRHSAKRKSGLIRRLDTPPQYVKENDK